ncbi:hypothetical protein G6L37_03220 [Agrobacterium rubi]|nr:hypothetical protein [Agrobacterium rubi]NTF24386.1 hypothetical protein [Agrobacterium rubi]
MRPKKKHHRGIASSKTNNVRHSAGGQGLSAYDFKNIVGAISFLLTALTNFASWIGIEPGSIV